MHDVITCQHRSNWRTSKLLKQWFPNVCIIKIKIKNWISEQSKEADHNGSNRIVVRGCPVLKQFKQPLSDTSSQLENYSLDGRSSKGVTILIGWLKGDFTQLNKPSSVFLEMHNKFSIKATKSIFSMIDWKLLCLLLAILTICISTWSLPKRLATHLHTHTTAMHFFPHADDTRRHSRKNAHKYQMVFLFWWTYWKLLICFHSARIFEATVKSSAARAHCLFWPSTPKVPTFCANWRAFS